MCIFLAFVFKDLHFGLDYTSSHPFLSLNRNLGLDPSWLQTWSAQGVDVAGPSTAPSSVGLGRVQMMMRHLASVGESYAQTALDDAAWSLWPMNHSQASTSTTTIPPGTGGRTGGLHLRTISNATNESLANILAMAETVREVMPHVPDEIIFQVNLSAYWTFWKFLTGSAYVVEMVGHLYIMFCIDWKE